MRSGFFSATAARRPFNRFVEQLDELHGITATAAQTLVVRAEDDAELHMDRVGRLVQQSRHARHREHHLEVLALTGVDEVQQQVGAEPLDAVEHAREVRRRVVETAGARSDDERQRLALAVREAGWEHDFGAFGFDE